MTYKQSELTPERNLTVSIDKGLKEMLDKIIKDRLDFQVRTVLIKFLL